MLLNIIIPRLTEFLSMNKELFPCKLEKIILFGSFARGTQRINSDIDLAIVAKDCWEHADRAQLRELLETFHDSISLFCTTQKAIDSTKDKFNANYWIREEGICLWQKSHMNILQNEI